MFPCFLIRLYPFEHIGDKYMGIIRLFTRSFHYIWLDHLPQHSETKMHLILEIFLHRKIFLQSASPFWWAEAAGHMLHPHNRVDMQEGSKYTEDDLPGWSDHISIVESILILLQTTLLDISASLITLFTLISSLFSRRQYRLLIVLYMEALVDNASFLCLYVGPNGSPSFTCWSWNSLVWYVFLTCSFSFDQLLLFTRLVMFERRLLFVGVVPKALLFALSPTISHANLRPQLS